MIFRQLFDRDSCTYTYLLADAQTRQAIIIDPVHALAERDEKLIRELDLSLTYIAETHVHADHVTGAGVLKNRLGGQIVVFHKAEALAADWHIKDGDVLQAGDVRLEVRHTPGHTDCSVTFVEPVRKMAFTGDTLLIRGCGRTDFQQGDARALFRSVTERIFDLDDDTLIYPGHDYQGRLLSTVAEERQFNGRLAQVTLPEFQEIMDNLDLPNPKHIDVAVPGNMKSGFELIEGDKPGGWCMMSRTQGGIPEVSVHWVHGCQGDVRVVDVREPEEFNGPLGHAPGAELVPLAGLTEHAARWNHDDKIVLLCRSGGRSGRGAQALEAQGFKRVASMAGGMLRWKQVELQVEAH